MLGDSSVALGHVVAELRLIFQPVASRGATIQWKDQFLCYIQQLNVIKQGGSEVNPTTHMHILKCAMQSNGTPMGDVIPTSQLRSYAPLIPCFEANVDMHFTKLNSHSLSLSFFLNRFFDKDFFYALLMS